MIETAIYDKLRGDTDVAALVSTRIYPANQLPETPTYPCIAWQRIDTDAVHTMAGTSQLENILVEFVALASTQLAAAQLAEKIRACLDGFAGTVSTVVIQSCLLDSQNDVINLLPLERQQLHGVSVQYNVWYTNS